MSRLPEDDPLIIKARELKPKATPRDDVKVASKNGEAKEDATASAEIHELSDEDFDLELTRLSKLNAKKYERERADAAKNLADRVKTIRSRAITIVRRTVAHFARSGRENCLS